MISFYFKEAFRLLKREKGASFLTVFSMILAILLSTSSICFLYLSYEFNNSLIEKITINIFLDENVNLSDKQYIKNFLNEVKWIKQVSFINKTQAKANFIKETGENLDAVLEVNPLPECYQIYLNAKEFNIENLEERIKPIKEIAGVDEIVYDYEFLISLFKFIDSFKYFLFIISFSLSLISVYLVYATNRLIYNSKNDMYDIMKLVGAKLRSIKIPIYLNGILIGMICSTICLLIVNFLLILLTNLLNIVNFTRLIILINILIPIFGLLFGILGGYFSTKNINLNINKI